MVGDIHVHVFARRTKRHTRKQLSGKQLFDDETNTQSSKTTSFADAEKSSLRRSIWRIWDWG
jgi:hypothetical protein